MNTYKQTLITIGEKDRLVELWIRTIRTCSYAVLNYGHIAKKKGKVISYAALSVIESKYDTSFDVRHEDYLKILDVSKTRILQNPNFKGIK